MTEVGGLGIVRALLLCKRAENVIGGFLSGARGADNELSIVLQRFEPRADVARVLADANVDARESAEKSGAHLGAKLFPRVALVAKVVGNGVLPVEP